jgi:hypothetical protein
MKKFKSIFPMIFTLGLNIAFHVGMAGYGMVLWNVFGGIVLGAAFIGTVYLGVSEIRLRRKRNKNKYRR